MLPVLCLFLVLTNTSCSGNQIVSSDSVVKSEIIKGINDYSSENWEIRLRGVQTVSNYGNTIYAKNVLLLLMKAADDMHPRVRCDALTGLKKMAAPAAMEKIRELALTDKDSNVRLFAISALEVYKSIQNEDIFLKGLDDQNWFVRETSLRGLLLIDDQYLQTRHKDIIIKAISDDNISIRLTALNSVRIKDPLLYTEISRIINNKESGLSILKAALFAVKGYRLDDITRNRIISLLIHRDEDIRLLSLQVLKAEKP